MKYEIELSREQHCNLIDLVVELMRDCAPTRDAETVITPAEFSRIIRFTGDVKRVEVELDEDGLCLKAKL